MAMIGKKKHGKYYLGRPAPRNPRSRRWKKIVRAGCQGTCDYWGEYDCCYTWECDYCPVLIEKEEAKYREFLRTFVGPPQENDILFGYGGWF